MADQSASTRVVVSIYGEECALRGDGSPEHLRGLAALVDARMRAVAGRTPQLSKTRVAVLTALQLADELGRLQEALTVRGAGTVPSPAPDPAPLRPASPPPAPPAAAAPPPRRTHRPRA
jgi:cell division protein ZapA